MTRAPAFRARLARAHTRIAVRLLLFNLLLVFLPAGGLAYLDAYEQHLLDLQERAMADAGRIVAAVVDPDALAAGLPPPVELHRIAGATDLRIRLVQADGAVVLDAPGRVGGDAGEDGYVSADRRRARLYRVGSWMWSRWLDLSGRPDGLSAAESIEVAPGRIAAPEVQRAMATGYGAATRLSPAGERSVTLHVAVPVRGGAGAVLVSQSTGRILRRLYDVRLRLFQVVVASGAVAVLVTAVASFTIVRPVRQLRDDALTVAGHRAGLERPFRGVARTDELGELARAVSELTARLEGHLRSSAQFAADVTHELRNPLASIRASVEMLSAAADAADRDRFRQRIEHDVGRLELLLGELREVTTVDALLEQEARTRLDLAASIREAGVDADGVVHVALPAHPVTVMASADRLRQVLHNLVDNARSFSPRGARVDVRLETLADRAVLTVRDRGPGIPADHLGRVFDRFFTHRPGQAQARQRHTGLGLAIAATIVRSYGGTIAATNHPEGGAEFSVTLPLEG